MEIQEVKVKFGVASSSKASNNLNLLAWCKYVGIQLDVKNRYKSAPTSHFEHQASQTSLLHSMLRVREYGDDTDGEQHKEVLDIQLWL